MTTYLAVLDLDDGIDGGEQLGVIVPLLGSLVATVEVADLDLATPCESWTTRDLLNHVVGGALMFAGAFEGGPIHDISGRMPDVVGDDPAAAFAAAVERFGAATQAPGAMDRVFALPWATMPGRTFLRFVAFDLLVHAWDLATTLGTEIEVPEPLVHEIDLFARRVLDPWTRDGVNFAAPTPISDAAPAVERLAAFAGRTR